jgi:uncharacterized membrane protein
MKLILAPLFVVLGVVFVGLAMPLVNRRVRPNKLYGLRVPATFADEWVWYEANARTGRDMLYVGLLQIAAALFLLPVPATAYAIINGVVLLAGTIWVCGVGMRRAERLLKERREGSAMGATNR